MARRLAAPLALLIAFGCSSGSGDSGGANASAGTPSGFCNGTFGRVLKFFEDECSSADKQEELYEFAHALLYGIALTCGPTLNKSISKGRAELNAAAAQTCVDGYDQLITQAGAPTSLPVPDLSLIAACNDAVVGKQAAGAPCAQTYECVSGLSCVGFSAKGDGVCSSPAVGEPCGAGDLDGIVGFSFGNHPECAGEAYCDSIYANGVMEKRCVAKSGPGEDCFDDDVCQTGLRCQLGVCGTEGPSAEGGACLNDDDCADALYCNQDVSPATCAAKKPAGATCTDGVFGGSECLGQCKVPEGADSGSCASFCGSG